MADQFLNPRDNAQMGELRDALRQLNARMQTIEEQMVAAQRETGASRQAEARGARTTATAQAPLEREVQAVRQQVVDYERLNALIAERIQLEGRAAAAAARTAVAAGGAAGRETLVLPAGVGGGERVAPAAAAGRTRQATEETQRLNVTAAETRANFLAANSAVVAYDTTLERTGGLSAAALNAMAAGTITVRELGSQVGQTIGKFGGWTAAAAAVYGAFGAVDELKKGVVDTSSAIQGLTKYIPAGQYRPEDARQQLVEQAQATATPIKDVGDAAQQFGKAFHNQNDVFTATHVALTASKLDNISLADSYKFLTAIVQEAGVSVSQLPGIFDQVSAAQDKLGARVSVLLPAVAGSLGAVQSSGGDRSQLVGLEALTAVRTGFDGATIANMFRQGASRYFNTPAARGVRARYGVNPNEGYTQALIDAIAGGQGLAGQQQQDLLTGFFGPRFGPRAAPLFRASPEQLKHFISETETGKYPGFANEQLGKTMGQANNQLALLKVNLQAIGAQLGGFASPLGGFVALLNDALKATEGLLKAWNSLPGAVKEVGSDALAGAGIIALGRRFNIGGAIAETGFGRTAGGGVLATLLAKNPEKIATAQAEEEAKAQRAFLLSERERAAVSTRAAALEAELATTEEGTLAAEEKRAASAARIMAINERIEALTAQQAGIQTEINTALEGELGAIGGGAGGAGVAAAGGAAAGGGAITKWLQARQAAFAEQSGLAASIGEAGFGAAAGAASLASRYALPVAAGAYLGYDVTASTTKEQERDITKVRQAIANAKTPAEAIAAFNKINESGGLHLPLIGRTGIGAGVASYLGGDTEAMRHYLVSRIGEFDVTDRAQQTGTNALGGVNALLRAAAGQHGGQQEQTYRQAVEKLLADRALNLVDGPAFKTALANVQAKLATAGIKGGESRLYADALARASKESPANFAAEATTSADRAKLYGTKGKDFNTLVNDYFAGIHQYGGKNDEASVQSLVKLQGLVTGSLDEQVSSVINLAKNAPTSAAQLGKYKEALGLVNNGEQEIRRVMQEQIRTDKGHPDRIARDRQAEQQLLGLAEQKRSSVISDYLSALSTQGELAVSKIQGVGPQAELRRAEEQLRQYGSELNAAKKGGADATTLAQLQTKYNNQLVTVLQDRINYDQQMADAAIQLAQSQTADPVQQAAIAVQRLTALYNQLKAAGADALTLQKLQAQIGQQQQAGFQAQISQQQAQIQTNLAQSNIGQPQQVQLQNAVSAAQQTISYLKSLPANRVSPTQMIQAYGALYQAQGALAQYNIQQGEAMIQAQTALKQAQTFDPVQSAQYAAQGAKQLLAYMQSHNYPAAQIQQQMANVAQANKAVLEAQWQKQKSTIEFLASTYQITGATEIKRLQSLLASMKKAHASYQSIQSVAQEIWNLEYGNTGNLNLNVGALHLPSTYEVKSAILGGQRSAYRKTSQGLLADVKTNVNLTVNVNRDSDTHKVGDAIQRALGTTVNGLGQAMGLV